MHRNLRNVSHSNILDAIPFQTWATATFEGQERPDFCRNVAVACVLVVLAKKTSCGQRTVRVPFQNVRHSNIFGSKWASPLATARFQDRRSSNVDELLLWLRSCSFWLKKHPVANRPWGYPSRMQATASFFDQNEHNVSHSNIFWARKVELKDSKNCMRLRIFPFDCKSFRASTFRRVFKSKHVCSNRFKTYSDVMKDLWWLANTSAILRRVRSWSKCLNDPSLRATRPESIDR